MHAAFDVIIVGAGHGGAQVAIALRKHKFRGSVAIVGDEPGVPYQRPPLSKAYLAGAMSYERILIRPETFWSDHAIEIITGSEVVAVDASAHQLRTADGDMLSYGKLVWAAGCKARTLTCSGSALRGVHVVRARRDVDRISAELGVVRHVAVIGGGYIGLEAASVLTKLGKQVTVVEAANRVLARVAGEPLSRFYEQEHRAHGLTVSLGNTIDSIEGRDGRVCGVRLKDGASVAAEMVIAGIGVLPAIGPLLAAGAAGSNGVQVDASCRTTLTDVFAVGDCAAHKNEFADGDTIRLESVQNATDQANVVAALLAGHAQSYHSMPWFWSDQYDLKLQTIGLSTGHDQAVVRGDPVSRRFSVVYLKSTRVIALDCVNCASDYVQGRLLIAGRVSPDPGALVDPKIPLKSLVLS